MAKRKDTYLNRFDGHFYPFEERMGDIHITYSTYDPSLVTHCHDFVEILCIVEGEGIHKIGEVEFHVRRGDLFLIDKGVSHSFSASTDGLCWINCIFRPESFKDGRASSDIFATFEDITDKGKDNLVINLKNAGDDMVTIFLDMLKEYDKKSYGYDKILSSYLDILLEKIKRRMLVDDATKSGKLNPIFEDAIAKIEDAPGKDYKATELAKESFMSPAAFSAGFKRYLGIPFSNFLASARIKLATNLLSETDLPISQILILSGYNDTKSFYRAFHKYTGTTPLNYRNKK